ncbi:hypothetical protein HK102_012575, partial [Quaeritorhiza haematococci]
PVTILGHVLVLQERFPRLSNLVVLVNRVVRRGRDTCRGSSSSASRDDAARGRSRSSGSGSGTDAVLPDARNSGGGGGGGRGGNDLAARREDLAPFADAG